jgi:glycosyltransferase involved in cell wall biosynthesis
MNSALKVLIIGYGWSEPQSSAAGLRDWNLIETFLGVGWEVIFAASSKENQFSQAIQARGVQICPVQPNDPGFDTFIAELKPDFVVFCRFMTEEQFGWRVQEHSPESVRIIDTVDLHFLRRGREKVLKKGTIPELNSEELLREAASIYRSDCSLILSSFETRLLVEDYKIPANLLCLSRFHYDPPLDSPPFAERTDFVTIGNFRHAPNADGVLWLHQKIWPLIRQKLPEAQLHIYGAYPPKEMMALTHRKSGFHVLGYIPDQFETFRKYRVNLAALRFGAGIKGKISDGWWTGTPVVTTPIGAEGMSDDLPWGGYIAIDEADFAHKAVQLYSDQHRWENAKKNGLDLIRTLYDRKKNEKQLILNLLEVKDQLHQRRASNLVGAMLSHHQHRSTRYFSKWIEEKNKKGQIQP